MAIYPPPCGQARQGVFAALSDCLIWLSDVLFQGTPIPHTTFLRVITSRIIFARCFFYNDWYQSCWKWEPQKSWKSWNSERFNIKTQPLLRPTQRQRLEGAKPLKIITVTQFVMFFRMSGTLKITSNFTSKWNPGHPKYQNTKTNTRKKPKQTTL